MARYRGSESGKRFGRLREYIQAQDKPLGLAKGIVGKVGAEREEAEKEFGEKEKRVKGKVAQQQKLFGEEGAWKDIRGKFKGGISQYLKGKGGGVGAVERGAGESEEDLAKRRLGAVQQMMKGEVGKFGLSGEELGGMRERETKLVGREKALGTEMGRYQLLGEAFGKKDYTPGMARLDQLLLQSRPEERAQLQAEASRIKESQLQQKREALQSFEEESRLGLGERATQVSGELGAERTAEIERLRGIQTGRQENIGQEVDAQRQAINKFEAGGQLSYDEMSRVGLMSPEELQQKYETSMMKSQGKSFDEFKSFVPSTIPFYGTERGGRLQAGEIPLEAEAYMTTQEAAQREALARVAGEQLTFDPTKVGEDVLGPKAKGAEEFLKEVGERGIYFDKQAKKLTDLSQQSMDERKRIDSYEKEIDKAINPETFHRLSH